MLKIRTKGQLILLIIFLAVSGTLSIECEKNCKICKEDKQRTQATICTECKESFYLFAEYCHPCIENCKKCTYSKTCIQCTNFRFFSNGKCRVSVSSILIHLTALVIIIACIFLLLKNWKRIDDVRGEMEVENEIQNMDKTLSKNTLDDSTLSSKSEIDNSGLDYMSDVDDEGNVRKKSKGVEIRV